MKSCIIQVHVGFVCDRLPINSVLLDFGSRECKGQRVQTCPKSHSLSRTQENVALQGNHKTNHN